MTPILCWASVTVLALAGVACDGTTTDQPTHISSEATERSTRASTPVDTPSSDESASTPTSEAPPSSPGHPPTQSIDDGGNSETPPPQDNSSADDQEATDLSNMAAPGGPQAADRLASEPGCSSQEPRRGTVTLRWDPADEQGNEQRVQLTYRRDGFNTGQYDLSGRLASDQDHLLWDHDLQPGLIHQWRVLTRHGDTWVPSTTGEFEGETCIGDEAG